MSPDLAASHVRAEIARQPDAWARAAALAPDLDVLPRPGESVAVIGCGTSWFMAAAYAALRESAGAGRTDAFPASELPGGRGYDRLVAISRSGTTTEVERAVATSPSPAVVLTAAAGTPVAEAAAETIVLDFAAEQSVVQTLFATTTLMLLRASLGEDLAGVIEAGRDVVSGGCPIPSELASVEQISFLGRHWAYGVAQEAALKLREASRAWTEAYPQMEYRHGPISIAESGRVVWVLGPAVPGLAEEVSRTGATLVDDDLDPVVDLVRAQLLAVARAEAAGLDPDHPRNLDFSVMLVDS